MAKRQTNQFNIIILVEEIDDFTQTSHCNKISDEQSQVIVTYEWEKRYV